MNYAAIVKDLNAKFPNYKFSNQKETYNVSAIIKIQSKSVPGIDTDIGYWGGSDCGYIASFGYIDVFKYLKSILPTCRVMDFIDGSRKGFFEIKE